MRSLRTIVSAVVAGVLPTQATAQPNVIVVTGSTLCSSEKPTATYGPVQRFDGIMFSFVDGVLFTPCKEGVRCDARAKGASLDLEWPEGEPKLGHIWDGWGYYRLTFEGRQGSWDKSGLCDLGSTEFYEIGRVISVKRIADR